MIFHPGILALLLGGTLSLAMLLYAGALGYRLAVAWDYESSSARQLTLERRTYLVSSIMNYVLAFGVLSLFLFVHTVDRIHPLFVGAMCATGTLNANPIGWAALATKCLVFFANGIWIAVNALDQKAEDYPLVRIKYGALSIVAALAALDLGLTYAYFSGLDPVVITSCCGALFGGDSDSVASVVASTPAHEAAWALYGTGGILMAMQALSLRKPSPRLRYLAALLGIAFFAAGLAATISFVAPHIYEMPFHHCPFDIVQRDYHYVGYVLYAALFSGTLFSVVPGILELLPWGQSYIGMIRPAQRRFVIASLVGGTLFLLLTAWPVLFGGMHFGGGPTN